MIIEPDDRIFYKQKYILCTLAKYNILNEVISAASGYPDETGTNIYAPVIPIMSADIFVKDEKGKDTKVLLTASQCVFPVAGDIQEFRPELIDGFELVDDFAQKYQV